MRPQLDQTAEDLKSKIARDREQLARFQSSVEQTRALMAEKDETSSEYHSLEQQLTQNLEIINFFEVIIKQDKEEISHLEVTEKMTEEDIYNLCEDYELFQDIVDKGNLYHIVKKFPHRHDLLEQLKKPQEFERLIPDLDYLVNLFQVTNNQGIDCLISIFLENSKQFLRLVKNPYFFNESFNHFPKAYRGKILAKFIECLILPEILNGRIENLLSTGRYFFSTLCSSYAFKKRISEKKGAAFVVEDEEKISGEFTSLEKLESFDEFKLLEERSNREFAKKAHELLFLYEKNILEPALMNDFELFKEIINEDGQNFVTLCVLFGPHKDRLFQRLIKDPDFFAEIYRHDLYQPFFASMFPKHEAIFSPNSNREQVVEKIFRLVAAAASNAEIEKNVQTLVELANSGSTSLSKFEDQLFWKQIGPFTGNPNAYAGDEEQVKKTVEEVGLAAYTGH